MIRLPILLSTIFALLVFTLPAHWTTLVEEKECDINLNLKIGGFIVDCSNRSRIHFPSLSDSIAFATKSLNMAHNKEFVKISAEAMERFGSLVSLQLHETGLTSFQPEILNSSRNTLRALTLGNNNFSCDCSIKELWQDYTQRKTVFPKELIGYNTKVNTLSQEFGLPQVFPPVICRKNDQTWDALDNLKLDACTTEQSSESSEWSEWSTWKQCNVDCGKGETLRTRYCKVVDVECNGPTVDKRNCTMPCDEKIPKIEFFAIHQIEFTGIESPLDEVYLLIRRFGAIQVVFICSFIAFLIGRRCRQRKNTYQPIPQMDPNQTEDIERKKLSSETDLLYIDPKEIDTKNVRFVDKTQKADQTIDENYYSITTNVNGSESLQNQTGFGANKNNDFSPQQQQQQASQSDDEDLYVTLKDDDAIPETIESNASFEMNKSTSSLNHVKSENIKNNSNDSNSQNHDVEGDDNLNRPMITNHMSYSQSEITQELPNKNEEGNYAFVQPPAVLLNKPSKDFNKISSTALVMKMDSFVNLASNATVDGSSNSSLSSCSNPAAYHSTAARIQDQDKVRIVSPKDKPNHLYTKRSLHNQVSPVVNLEGQDDLTSLSPQKDAIEYIVKTSKCNLLEKENLSKEHSHHQPLPVESSRFRKDIFYSTPQENIEIVVKIHNNESNDRDNNKETKNASKILPDDKDIKKGVLQQSTRKVRSSIENNQLRADASSRLLCSSAPNITKRQVNSNASRDVNTTTVSPRDRGDLSANVFGQQQDRENTEESNTDSHISAKNISPSTQESSAVNFKISKLEASYVGGNQLYDHDAISIQSKTSDNSKPRFTDGRAQDENSKRSTNKGNNGDTTNGMPKPHKTSEVVMNGRAANIGNVKEVRSNFQAAKQVFNSPSDALKEDSRNNISFIKSNDTCQSNGDVRFTVVDAGTDVKSQLSSEASKNKGVKVLVDPSISTTSSQNNPWSVKLRPIDKTQSGSSDGKINDKNGFNETIIKSKNSNIGNNKNCVQDKQLDCSKGPKIPKIRDLKTDSGVDSIYPSKEILKKPNHNESPLLVSNSNLCNAKESLSKQSSGDDGFVFATTQSVSDADDSVRSITLDADILTVADNIQPAHHISSRNSMFDANITNDKNMVSAAGKKQIKSLPGNKSNVKLDRPSSTNVGKPEDEDNQQSSPEKPKLKPTKNFDRTSKSQHGYLQSSSNASDRSKSSQM